MLLLLLPGGFYRFSPDTETQSPSATEPAPVMEECGTLNPANRHLGMHSANVYGLKAPFPPFFEGFYSPPVLCCGYPCIPHMFREGGAGAYFGDNLDPGGDPWS